MIDLEKAQRVVDMIASEIMPEYAYTSFEAKCRDYGITPEDFNNFLDTALELIKKAQCESRASKLGQGVELLEKANGGNH